MTINNTDERGKCPKWIAKQLNAMRKDGRLRYPHTVTIHNAHEPLQWLPEFDSFIDHWGRFGNVFFTEPYATKATAARLAKKLADILHCEWRFAESKWNPPSTVRVEFYRLPIQERLYSKRKTAK